MFRVYVLFTIVIICNNSNSYQNFRNRIWSIPVKHVVRFLVRSHEIPRDGGGISRKPQSWLPQAKKHIDIPRSSHCWPTKISHVYPIFIPLSVTMPFISQLFSHENIPLLFVLLFIIQIHIPLVWYYYNSSRLCYIIISQ